MIIINRSEFYERDKSMEAGGPQAGNKHYMHCTEKDLIVNIL